MGCHGREGGATIGFTKTPGILRPDVIGLSGVDNGGWAAYVSGPQMGDM